MTDTRTTSTAGTTRELKSDHCPDCGGPIVTAGTGQRGCCLCGAFREPAEPGAGAPRPR